MKINKQRLNEANGVDAVADAINADPEDVIEKDDNKNEVFAILDEAKETAEEILDIIDDSKEVPRINGITNVLLVGAAGAGKTGMIHSWADANGINLIELDAKTIDESDMDGIVARDPDDPRAATKLATKRLDGLNKPNSVLFLDEFNRAKKNIRGTLLELINNHVVNDDRTESKKRFLPGFLFTIAAVNPASGETGSAYNTDKLDLAELSRFEQIDIFMDPQVQLNFLEELYGDAIKKYTDKGNDKAAKKAEGRLGIARELLGDPHFEYDSDEEQAKAHKKQHNILVPRSLTNLLSGCNGTKEDFLKKWPRFCNPNKLKMAETLLADYDDINDSQNAALDDHDKKKKEKKSAFGKSTGNEFRDKGALADIDSFNV